jgi:dTDP-4-dehydrorhamnose reductase
MRVLVTGREGQVVRALLERGATVPGLELIAAGRPDLDLAVPGSAAAAVRRIEPEVVISAAAYTAVDQAEDEPELANRVNGEAPGELAGAAREVGARIIHLSTDYVFDGRKPEPYREDDPTGPIGAYGRSKLLGEERVRAGNPDHLILRTAWVYSPWGKNFVKTMMALARSRDEVKVVADQRGSPTSALDIADGLLALLACLQKGAAIGCGQTYHLAGTGVATWCEFAGRIFADCARLGRASATACPIATFDYPTKAARPVNSMLDSGKFAEAFGYRAPDWRMSATAVVERLA